MRVGVLGGGQLARMLALAGRPLGLRFSFLEPADDPPVAELGRLVSAPYDDPDGLERFIEGVDVVTFEFENVPAAAAGRLAERVPVLPPATAFAVARDRLEEKALFGTLGIPVAPYRPVESREALDAALEEIGAPSVLKTTRFGYDGKGQFLLESPADADAAWEALRTRHDGAGEGAGAVPLVLEAFVSFTRELSILVVRGRDGEMRSYPLVENHHQEGILRRTVAPAPAVPAALQAEAEAHARRVVERLEYTGVLAIELFETSDGLLANEMAPRVHNSGHWTQDGAVCDQFENHLRAICGLPLGETTARGHTEMVNLIGGLPRPEAVLAVPGAHLHLYEKEPRPGRKLGHVNLTGSDPQELRRLRERIETHLP